ncbi:hypothetical protein METHB2_160015 [Candidatus Methylobacter favarea]|uniref:Uncharacterized protein n=1 Tax=Candidatus Methylobacter favarea TaxID=2707345 RepID=A0A8S0Y9C2_9GAMM|nr:hypothetical protein [Candidatus Methylobacter favarea]CAA9889948.1 hypothetical protein METHB2_160015 [Candidatus Methylobacter favarea]
MNIKETLRSPHIFIELLLFVIIIVLVNSKLDIKVDPKGFVKNIALNYALTGDGAVIVSDPKGNVILRSDQDSLDKLHSISISRIGNKKNNTITQGLFESLIPSAFAGEKYFQFLTNVDGQIACRWYDDNTPC